MADVQVGRLVAILKLNDKQFQKQLKTTQRRLKQTSRQISQLGRTVTRSLSVPLALAGVAITKMAVDFDRASNRVRALTQATGADFERLTAQAKELGRTTAFSATQAAEGQAFLAQAGFKTNQILSALPGTLDLAAAGQLELANAADIASNVLQAFRLEAKQTGRVVDVLSKTFTTSNTDLEQLAEAMKDIAPVAQGFGQSIEATSAAIGLLGNAGIQGQRAGTALRNALVLLADAAPEAQRVIDALGVTTRNAAGNLLPFVDILEKLEIQGATTTQIFQIFGKRAGPAVQALLGLSPQLRAFTKELEDAGGTAKRVAEEQLKGLVGAFTKLKSSTEGAALALADAGLSGFVQNIADRLTEFTRAIATADKSTLNLILTLGAIGVAAGPVILVLGGLAASLSALIGFAAGAVALLGGGALGLATILGLVGIAGVAGADGVNTFLNSLETSIDVAKQAAEKFKALKSELSGLSLDKQLVFAKTISEEIESQIASVTSSLEEFGIPEGGIFGKLDSFFGFSVGAETGPLEQQLKGLREQAASVSQLIGDIEIQIRVEGEEEARRALEATANAGKGLVDAAIAQKRAILDTLAAGEEIAAKQAEVFGASFGQSAAVADLLEAAINSLLDLVGSGDADVLRLAGRFRSLTNSMNENATAADAAADAQEAAANILADADAELASLTKTLQPVGVRIDKTVAKFLKFALVSAKTADEIAEVNRQAADLRVTLGEIDIQNTLVDTAQTAATDIERVFDELSRNVQRSLADAIENGFNTDSVKDFAKSALDIIKRVFANEVAAVITGGLSGAFRKLTSGAGGGGGGFFGSLAGFVPSIGGGGGGSFLSGGTSGLLTTVAGIVGGGAGAGLGGNLTSLLASAGTSLVAQGFAQLGVLSGAVGAAGIGPVTGAFGSSLQQSILSTANPANILGGIVGGVAGGFINDAIGIGAGVNTAGAIGSGVLGGIGAIGGGILGGTLLGARFGSLAGPIGAAIGALIGTIVGGLASLFGKKPKVPELQLLTSATRDNPQFEEPGTSFESPFGFVGVDIGSRKLNTEFRLAIGEQVAGFDESIAEFLSDTDIEVASVFLQANAALKVDSKSGEFVAENAQILADRIKSIIESLTSADTVDRIFDGFETGEEVSQRDIEQILGVAFTFLEQRQKFFELLDSLKPDAKPLTDAAQALEKINDTFEQLTAIGETFGFAAETIIEARDNAIAALVTGFDETISSSILKLTDPLALAMQQLVDQQRTRLDDAIDLGADLVEVERLNSLERIELLKGLNDPIESVLDALSGDLGGNSGLGQFGILQTQFDDLFADVIGGAAELRPELAQVGASLATLAKDVFGTGGPFGEIIASIQTGLQEVLAQEILFPGSSTDPSIPVAIDPGTTTEDSPLEDILNDLREDGQLQNETQVEVLTRIADGLEGLDSLQSAANVLLDQLANGG